MAVGNDDFGSMAEDEYEESELDVSQVNVKDLEGMLQDDRLTVLKRQVDTKTSVLSQTSSSEQTVAFSKLISNATGGEKCVMYIGWVFAFLTGIGMPLFAQFMA